MFPPLTQEQIVVMVDNMIAGVELRLKDRDMSLELTQAAKNLLAERGFDPVLGARPLRRTIQREIEDVLSEKMLYGEVGPGQIVAGRRRGRGSDRDVHASTARRSGELPDLPPFETAEVAASDAPARQRRRRSGRLRQRRPTSRRPAAPSNRPVECTLTRRVTSDGSASFEGLDSVGALEVEGDDAGDDQHDRGGLEHVDAARRAGPRPTTAMPAVPRPAHTAYAIETGISRITMVSRKIETA